MGMVLYFRQADASEVEAMLGAPDSWEDAFFADAPPDTLIDFDKAWHALHHMLTGSGDATDSSLSLIIDGSLPVCVDANGFGGFWIIPPEQMKKFAAALADLSDDDVAARYDPSAMDAEQVYLSDVFVDEGAEALEYVLQGVPALRRFATACAQKGSGAVKCLA